MSDIKNNDEENISSFEDDLIENDDFPEVVEGDFDDDMSFDEGFGDELSDDESYDNFDGDDYSKPQSRGGINWFNIGIIGFAVIGLGVLTYNFFPGLLGGGASPSQSTATQRVSPQDNQQLAQQAITEPSDLKVQDSFFDNPESLNTASNQQTANVNLDNSSSKTPEEMDLIPTFSDQDMEDIFAAIPQAQGEVPVAPEVEETGIIDTLPMPSDANITPLDDIEELNIVETLPAADMSMQDDMIEEETPSAESPRAEDDVLEALEVNSVTQEENGDIDKVNARIDEISDTMQSFMDRLDAKLDTISSPTQQTVTVDNSQQLNQIQKTLSILENRLDAVESMSSSTATAEARVSEQPKPQVRKTKTDVLTPIPSPVVSMAPQKSREQAYVPPKITWELRGASNGQAVLAVQGTQNLNTIQVGQIVRGLGQIQSIAIENGQWVVRGTNGIVRQ